VKHDVIMKDSITNSLN